MANIIMGCDLNDTSSDQKTLKTIGSILEKAGHKVELLSVGPNYVQSAMQQSSNKGKTAIYLVNGADLQTYRDFHDGITQGYYYAKYAYFGLQGWISPSTCSCNGAKSAKLKRAHDDASPVSYTAALVGMTTAEVCEKYKKAIAYACGSSAEELGNNLVKVIGGGSNSDEKKSSSGSTAKECIQKLLTHWDGDVECRIRGDTVYINKIRDPKTNYNLILQEGVNVFTDSVQITDLNPNTVNHLMVKWTGGTITLKDEELIQRFGEVKKEMEAVRKVVKKETTTKTTTTDTDTDADTDTDTGTDTDAETTDDASAAEETTTETKTTVVEEKITNYKDALAFANTEWNKIRRDNGHTLECQTRGSPNWKVGEWVKVILPSFDENGFMYITRTSQSDDGGEWNCNLSLADYPPGWGAEQIETSSSDEESSDSDSESTEGEST